TLQLLRDGRSMSVTLKLAERPARDRRELQPASRPLPSSQPGSLLGIAVRGLDPEAAARYRLPDDTRGVIVSRVEPMSPGFDADIERGHVVLEINRQRVQSIDDYRRLTDGARPGDILTMYVYKPELNQRTLETVKIDER
ncbi:MAG: PDZ domain-containing protein, partial [Candidatus Rokuibacteriota bacterium]